MFAYNHEFHIFGQEGNGTAHCTAYRVGNCLYNATYDSSAKDLTVYRVGYANVQSGYLQVGTIYNVGFAYAPPDAPTLQSLNLGPRGAVFQSSSSLSNNVLNAGQTVEITFDSINATGAPDPSGNDGLIWVGYATSAGMSDHAGSIASLTNCSFVILDVVSLK